MGSKLLTEASFFNCAGNPAIQIYGKDHLQIIASDKAAHILTDKSRCGVIAPLTCAILTAKAGGMTPVPCELNEAMPVSWIDADTIVKIKGNAALSEKSYCKCPVCPESNITPVYTDSISVLTPVQAIADISSGKSDSRSEDNDCSGGDTKENRKSSSDASVKEEPVKQKAEETEPDDKEDDAFSKYCRCDYKNCNERSTCEYYSTQINIVNDSAKLSNNFKKDRSNEWNEYIAKHNEKNAGSSEGGWRIAAHHIISGNQVLLMKDSDGNLLYGDIVKLAVYFGYDVNNAFNCILLPTNENNFGQREPLTKIANAYEVMGLMGRQWHVGGHEYTLSADTLNTLADYYAKNPDQYPTRGNPLFFKNYKTAMKEEMDKLQAGIRDQCWKKNYKYKREKFISKLNRLSRDVESRLLAFENSPRKSFPFFVSKIAVEYAYNIPSTSKLIVLFRGKKGITAKKYRIERYVKNDLQIIFNEKGELLLTDDNEFIRFCDNIMYFIIDSSLDYQLPFSPSEIDSYVVKNADIAADPEDYLQTHSNEAVAFVQQNSRQYQPAAKIISHRLRNR